MRCSSEAMCAARLSSLARPLAGVPPVVWHPAYSLPQLAAGHRFPMPVFAAIKERLLRLGIVQPAQLVEAPSSVTRETLEVAHCPHYAHDVCEGTLSAAALRRIGLGSLTEVLRERTLSEVAGALSALERACLRLTPVPKARCSQPSLRSATAWPATLRAARTTPRERTAQAIAS